MLELVDTNIAVIRMTGSTILESRNAQRVLIWRMSVNHE
jgi:hypothetical protein